MSEVVRFQAKEEHLEYLRTREIDPARFAKAAFEAELRQMRGDLPTGEETAAHYRESISEARSRQDESRRDRLGDLGERDPPEQDDEDDAES